MADAPPTGVFLGGANSVKMGSRFPYAVTKLVSPLIRRNLTLDAKSKRLVQVGRMHQLLEDVFSRKLPCSDVFGSLKI